MFLDELTKQVPRGMIDEIEKLEYYLWRLYMILFQTVTLINIIRYAPIYVKNSNYGQLAYQWGVWFMLSIALCIKLPQ